MLEEEWGGIFVMIISPRIKIKDANRSSFAPANRKGSNGGPRRWAGVQISLGPVRPAQLERHYSCFMLACRIPLKRLMSGSMSQPRTRYPPAACSDLVNEFISSVATAGSALPRSHSQPVSCRVESASKLSAVALQYNDSNLASQLESVWGLFFLHEDAIKLFPNCQLFKNYAKQRINEPKSHLSQTRRKLVFTWQQRCKIQLLIFACLPSLFVVPLSFKVEMLLTKKKALSNGLVQATVMFLLTVFS